MSVATLLITGPGGIGKTTVALEVSRQLQASGIGHAAVPDAMVMVVRLHATEEILMERVHQREVGSGLKYQARSSVEQLR